MPSLTHSLPRFILVMLIVAMVTVVASPKPEAAAIPLAVEYGVTGQEDLST